MGVEKIGNESKNISDSLDKITDHVQELRDTVAENVIATAKSSIDDLRKGLPDFAGVGKYLSALHVQCSISPTRSISAEESINVSSHFSNTSNISHETS